MTRKDNQSQDRSRKQLHCDYCKKTGHTRDQCFGLYGYPSNRQPQGNSGDKGKSQRSEASESSANVIAIPTSSGRDSPIPGLSFTQYQQLVSLLDHD